jgi:ribonuclease H2 subunit A
MLKPAATYNLNAQAMDATIDLIKEVFAKGINVKEIYIDTIGSPSVYQKKLEWIFPTTMITVAKKADSLYPCVSAASVCAKVTRDAALEVCYQAYANSDPEGSVVVAADGWGSGYPSDARCTTWLKSNMDPLFGWGTECRFSWGTAKDLLDSKGLGSRIDWPTQDEDDQSMRVTDFFTTAPDDGEEADINELATWFGRPVAETAF